MDAADMVLVQLLLTQVLSHLLQVKLQIEYTESAQGRRNA